MFPDLARDDVFRIETRRLWLRWPQARDAAAIIRLAGERTVADMTARIPHPIDPLAIDSFVIEARRCNTEGEGLAMALTLRAAPTALIGIVSIGPHPAGPGAHLGYWLGTPHWGEGLMSEAAATMVGAYFAYAGGDVLSSASMTANIRSRRVLEKCGFVRQGSDRQAFPARGEEREVDLFRLTRAEWSAARSDG
ncbi:GNAT family N-acetyltransferase [Methylobacterium haplocladii]|uniref:N-acetyltransferase GCN5 n=1 Tax=Methylobacterium haplocladii TaxID=1176176 RepID=A0A512ILL8_9HYPH|nr:GNAT family N-acetyltransferase [Methylobacterium haplocladii]GEO98616.1 N-acetyltransferase GCN5 [Methylobacterium haplocladii]GJD83983.1 hypothetical protein HPGCJGGD_1858 [Methylobacterium haplocladii]GLS59489.1 N-acetyltransferase GCN5 [Methylobacterium haplocladii]